MERRPGGEGGRPGIGEMVEAFLGFPSPEKILAELQRLNSNLEMIAPDLRKLATALEADKMADIRNLTEVLKKLDVGDLKRMINEVSRLGGQIYERLWGNK